MTERNPQENQRPQQKHPQVPTDYSALSTPIPLPNGEQADWVCFARHKKKGNGVLIFKEGGVEKFLTAQATAILLGHFMILAADILPTQTNWNHYQQGLAAIEDWLLAKVPFIKGRASLQHWLEQIKKEETSLTKTEEGSQPHGSE